MARKLNMMVDAADKADPIKNAGAFLPGTTAGYSALLGAQNFAAGQDESRAEKNARVMEQMRQAEERTAKATEETAKLIRDQQQLKQADLK